MMDVTGDMQKEPVSVAGIGRMEDFALLMSIPFMDEDVNYIYFNTEVDYGYLTFTVACPEPTNQNKATETLYIGGDWDIKKEIKLSCDMKPTTYTVDIDGCDQLMFWLECGEWWSEQYYFYDITLNK